MLAALLSFPSIFLPAPYASYLPLRALRAAFFLPPERFLAALRLTFFAALRAGRFAPLAAARFFFAAFLAAFFFFAGAFFLAGAAAFFGAAAFLGAAGLAGSAAGAASAGAAALAAAAGFRSAANTCTANCAPYGSTNCAIQSPPGTSIGPLTSVPRAPLAFLTASFTSLTRT